ncbi:MAG: hypothetical protein HRU40_12750, partial [Saprospiraceae bacterium]|nr:hypothetical protein [Saprospiraceae bacterium]
MRPNTSAIFSPGRYGYQTKNELRLEPQALIGNSLNNFNQSNFIMSMKQLVFAMAFGFALANCGGGTTANGDSDSGT